MNIDAIIAKEIQCNHLDKVEASLNEKGLAFNDLKNYDKVGSSDVDRPDHVC